MTVLLVLATFLVLIVLDYALNRRKVMATVSLETGNAMTPATTGPAGGFVGGFHAPDNLSYHPGHSWLVRSARMSFGSGPTSLRPPCSAASKESNCRSREPGFGRGKRSLPSSGTACGPKWSPPRKGK